VADNAACTELDWAPRAVRRLIAALSAAAVLVAAGTAAGLAASGSGAAGTGLSARDRGWQRDVAYLASQLPRVHVDGITRISRASWDAAAKRLEAQVPALSNGRVLVGLARMVASLGDDETQLLWPAAHWYPFILEPIGPGSYVALAPAADRWLLGARLVAIDGHPLTQVLGRLLGVIDFQDPGLARELALGAFWPGYDPGLVNNAGLLSWLGLTRSESDADFTVQLVGGGLRTVRLGASATFPAMVSLPLPLYRQNTGQPYWLRVLRHQQAVYLKYNQCLSGPGFGQLADRALAIMRAHPGYRLIVDLRDNSGGDSEPFQSLIDGLLADPAINRTGRIFGLINGQTDSSAGIDANDLSTQVHGLLVGQQIADPIDEYGDSSGLLRLPYGGVQVSYTTAVVNPAGNHYGNPALTVAPTLRDVLDGSDPVLAVALSFGHKN
jgi:hypothetical protein